jgi:hypothetical protein
MFQNVKRFQELFQRVINVFKLGYLMNTELEVQLSGSFKIFSINLNAIKIP